MATLLSCLTSAVGVFTVNPGHVDLYLPMPDLVWLLNFGTAAVKVMPDITKTC